MMHITTTRRMGAREPRSADMGMMVEACEQGRGNVSMMPRRWTMAVVTSGRSSFGRRGIALRQVKGTWSPETRLRRSLQHGCSFLCGNLSRAKGAGQVGEGKEL
eukprot:668502-Hanusia_phi.AAC.2